MYLVYDVRSGMTLNYVEGSDDDTTGRVPGIRVQGINHQDSPPRTQEK